MAIKHGETDAFPGYFCTRPENHDGPCALISAEYAAMTTQELLIRAMEKIDGMDNNHSKILEVANEIKAEVGPIVEKLSSHPMFRMILGSK